MNNVETEDRIFNSGETETNPPTLISRVVTVPLVTPKKEQWKKLFDAARESARFGNHRLAENYLRARGVKLEPSVFVEYNEKLSSVARLGVDTHVKGAWQRDGKKILAGVQKLAQMDAYRALSFQVHQGGGSLARTPDGMSVIVRILPGRSTPLEELPIYMPAIKREMYLTTTLDNIAAKKWKLKRINILFKRTSAKVKAQLVYVREKSIAAELHGTHTATLALQDDGTRLVLRCNNRELHLTDHLHRLRTMKENYAQIHSRIRMSLGKARRWHRLRQQLAKAGSFEEWAKSPLHEMSRRIIEWCQFQNVGLLEWAIDGGDLPWHSLKQQCEYKGSEAGIIIQKAKSA